MLALVVGALLWLQRSVLGAPFFADDFLFLDQVRHRSLAAALAGPDPIGNFLRPVGRQLHFWWLAHASGESPVAFHAVNLGLFAASLALLFTIVRRVAGSVTATFAAGFLALHYAADVPLQWACGSQDLLALTLALAAIALHLGGRRALAAPAFLLAMLSKETVAFTPLIAVMLDRDVGTPWSARARRAWPLCVAAAAWAALWLATAPARHGAEAGLAPRWDGVPAALFHLVQVALGLEARSGGGPGLLRVGPPWIPLALVAVAMALIGGGSRKLQGHEAGARPRGAPRSDGPGPVAVGLAWAALGALPVAVVAPIWSAYYYLFALCGVSLALGAALARVPRAFAIAVVAVLAWGSQGGRALDEFATAPGAWTVQSHVNRFYVERSMRTVERYLGALRRARPGLPQRSTVFFFGMPPNVGWQSADGPLLRWAYRDSSLRSYFLTSFTAARAGRGANFFFRSDGDSLLEEWRDRSPWPDVALSMMLEDRESVATEALLAGLAHDGTDAGAGYHLALLRWSAGDTAEASRLLRRAGRVPDPGPTPEAIAAYRMIAAGGDTVAAAAMLDRGLHRHALDAGAHALLADILLSRFGGSPAGFVEALAARILAPERPDAWRRWAMVQMSTRRFPQAERSLDRYFALGGAAAASDAEARGWAAALRKLHPGTALAQRLLRNERLPTP